MSTAIAIQSNQVSKRKARKAGRLKSVSIPKIGKNEVLNELGWSDMPARLISAIDRDLELFIDEYKGNYTTVDDETRQRRNKIQYWINNYKEGICDLETAEFALMTY